MTEAIYHLPPFAANQRPPRRPLGLGTVHAGPRWTATVGLFGPLSPQPRNAPPPDGRLRAPGSGML